MSWSLHRQIIIFLLVTGFFALTGFILWFIYHPRPSCADGLQNQDELGVDCGGICFAVCSSEVTSPVILWRQSFLLEDNNYGIAALIENQNNNFGIGSLDYVFKVFGDGQVLLATVPGNTYVNPDEKVVIYEPNISLGESGTARAVVVLELATTTWQRQNTPTKIELKTSEERFDNNAFGGPQARAVIRNDSLETYRDVEVYVVLSDSGRNVFAVSSTVVPELGAGEAKNIFFTWPRPFDVASSSEVIIDVFPRFNTLKPKTL